MQGFLDTQGKAGDTVRLVATDAAQHFPNSKLVNASGKPAIAVNITCEDNQVRFTHGDTAVPTQGDSGLGHILYIGQSYRISNGNSIRSFQHLNHTNGSVGVLQATFEYD